MRLTRQSEIAIGILTACARSPMRRITTLQAAEASASTKDHAAQVVNILVHGGFLSTERGRKGGIALAVPANEIFLGDVLRRVQPDLVHYTETADRSLPNTVIPTLNTIVATAETIFLSSMNRYSITDLAGTEDKAIGIRTQLHHTPCPSCDLPKSVEAAQGGSFVSY